MTRITNLSIKVKDYEGVYIRVGDITIKFRVVPNAGHKRIYFQAPECVEIHRLDVDGKTIGKKNGKTEQ